MSFWWRGLALAVAVGVGHAVAAAATIAHAAPASAPVAGGGATAGETAASSRGAGASPPAAQRELVVALYKDPPFVLRTEDGQWTGLAVELWQEVAQRLDVPYRFAESDLEGALAGLREGRVDVIVGSVLSTPERERAMDLTTPFLHVGMAIASRAPTVRSWLLTARTFLGGQVVGATAALLATAFAFGVVVWLLERRRNPEHFGGTARQGIGEGIWWSATTMTTVGYGDRTPVTFLGRVVGIVWMFVSIVLVSGFTALVTSSLTAHQLAPAITSTADLRHVRVGAVAGSEAANRLTHLGLGHVTYDDVEKGVADLAAGRIDAFAEEQPVLAWLARHRFPGEVVVVAQPLERGFASFALPYESPLRRPMNVLLTEILASPWWREQKQHYLNH